MITLTIIGVDPCMVAQISKAMTGEIAKLYEVSSDEINFVASDSFYIHDGVEQNTWNALVKVNAPLKVKVLEGDVVRVIREYMKNTCIHLAVEFYYYSQDNRYEFIDETYDRFMTEKNSVDMFEEEDYEEHDDFCEGEECEDDEPYLGDAFEGFNKIVNGEE